MCGRFSLSDLLGLIMHFKLDLPRGIRPRYNIAPSQDILAIINDGVYRAEFFRWGLIPFWSQKVVPGIINARAETVDKKPSFKQSFAGKRCLVPADGFYEWGGGGSRKKPYRVTLKNKNVFVFAGLWDTWISPEGKTINSCAIITTAANTLLASIHHRMPVILPESAGEAWLNRDVDILTLKDLLNPYPAELMESYEVSALVNNPQNDSSEIIKPV